MDERVSLLKDGKISKAVNKMAMPAIIGLLVMSIYNLVDTMFVSWIGPDAVAATTVIFPIMMLASAVGLTFGIGGGSLVSRMIGKKDIDRAKSTASTAFYTALGVGIVLLILAFAFNEQLFMAFGATDEILDITKSYGNYILIAIPIMVLNMVLNNLLRSEGSSKLSMIGMAIGSVLNIILDPVMIFGFGWGVAGAAIATTLSQTVTFVILLYQYISKKALISINLKDFKFDKTIYGEIFKIGLPTFLKQLLFAVTMAMLNNSAGDLGGEELLAAVGLITRITMLSANVIFGLGQGFQPVAGYNSGAGREDRVYEALGYTIKISTIVSVGISLLFVLLAKPMLTMFHAEGVIMDYGVRGIIFYSIGMLTLGFTNTIATYYQALGKGTEALVLSTARQGTMFIPVILVLPLFLQIDGVLMTQMVADILTTLLTVAFIIPILRSKKAYILQQAAA